MKAKIEKYLEENNLAYARAIRTELGEYVSIGDLIDNYTKELQEQLAEKTEALANSENAMLNLIKYKNEVVEKLAEKEKELSEVKSNAY